jgi:hypothetical protein
MPLTILFNPYGDDGIFDKMREGRDPFYPPHCMLEVLYTPALAHPRDAGWAIMQMGTRAWLSHGHKTREEAVTEAIRRAKLMLPNGIVFERGSGEGTCPKCGSVRGHADLPLPPGTVTRVRTVQPPVDSVVAGFPMPKQMCEDCEKWVGEGE